MGKLRAAAGQVDLRAPVGCHLTGFAGRPGPSTSMHDPVFARALLLDDGETKLLVVSCDLLGLAPETVAELRLRIQARAAIPHGNIMICCTHTHSGPASAPCRGNLGYLDYKWLEEAKARIVKLTETLPGELQDATLSVGTTLVREIGHNRQDSSHPFDEELMAVSVDASDGNIATMVNYSAHAVVMGGGNLAISGDFPAAVSSHLQRMTGGIGLYLQGACGDVNPHAYLRDGPTTFDDVDLIGRRLAEAAAEALKDAEKTSDVRLAVARKYIDIPIDPSPTLDEVLQTVAQAEEERRAAGDDPANGPAGAESMEQMAGQRLIAIEAGTFSDTIRTELFAAAINDLRIVAAPFETYSAVGLEIKKALAPHKSFFVGYANGLFGYLHTDEAKRQGGYGPAGSYQWFSPLLTAVGYGAAEILTRESIELAKSL